MSEHYDELCRNYEILGQNAEQLAMSRRLPRVRRGIDSIAVECKETEQAITNQLQLIDNAARKRFFARRLPQLQEDIQYALAGTTYLLQSRAESLSLKPGLKERVIDRKIKKYQRELEKVEFKSKSGLQSAE